MNFAPTNLPRKENLLADSKMLGEILCMNKLHTIDSTPCVEIRVPHHSPAYPPQPWEQKDHDGNFIGTKGI
jgi:hypothetical protein